MTSNSSSATLTTTITTSTIPSATIRHILSVLDVREAIFDIFKVAQKFKAGILKSIDEFKGKSLGMIFEKPSTRTRVSFEVAMTQLGGHAIYLSKADLQLGRGETIADTARVLSRYVDVIVYRAFSHSTVIELARHATVPVINGLDELEHPCQIIADLFTIYELKNNFRDIKLAYVGDGNNVCNSLLLGSAIVGLNFTVGCPSAYQPDGEIIETAKKLAEGTGANIELIFDDPVTAVRAADIIYTDVWVSMGDEAEREVRERVFQPYQVNTELLSHANLDCIVMHCLPAHRGLEITDEVIDSNRSKVFEQAENRLHVQKAILAWVLHSPIFDEL